MADLVVVRQDVAVAGQVASIPVVVAGEALEQGMPIRITTNNQAFQSQADSAENAACAGITLSPAAIGERVAYVPNGGRIKLGVMTVIATSYVVSANKGKIAPETDLVSGNYKTVISIADAVDSLLLRVTQSGVAVP